MIDTPKSDRLAGQQRVFIGLLNALRPHWRQDRALASRIESLLRSDRRFGSRDRRLYRELLYTALRLLPWIEHRPADEATAIIAHFAAELPATVAFRERYGRHPLPADLDLDELLPTWLRAECPAAFEPAQCDVLLRRAPLWLRLQTDDPESVREEFAQAGWAAVPSPVLPEAWRLPGETDITKSTAYQEGRVEIQDLGSQLILASSSLTPGEHWLDACAGAGGKTLQLARLLGPDGRVTAHDIRPAALEELKLRAARAGLNGITITAAPEGGFDGVLVDAPCTGTGTWRRAPHLKWTTSPADVAAASLRQLGLLLRFSHHVRPGGRLIYATCSLCRTENEGVVAGFLERQAGFQLEPIPRAHGLIPGPLGLSILPATHDTDGFFVAALRRTHPPAVSPNT